MKLVRQHIRNCEALIGAKRILAAVSGGPDSVVLLDALYHEGFDIVVAHCNFHLRGKDADGDAEFVRSLAELYKLQFCQADFDTFSVAEERHISIEMAARDLRYEWFELMADKYDCDRIAVAHNADDTVETFFLNLTRGTGLQGLSGMAESRGRIVRPMLDVSREQIMRYIDECHLKYRIDSTNDETLYTRNKFRHDIIPMFTEINPSFLETMRENMRFLQSANKIVEAYSREAYKKCVLKDKSRVRIDVDALSNFDGVETLLYLWLSEFGFSSDVIVQLVRSINDVSGKQFYSATHRAVINRSYIDIYLLGVEDDKIYLIGDTAETLEEPFHIEISRIEISDFHLIKSSQIANLDYRKLRFPLTLRHWQNGDWFIPFGMRGRKKISDFLTDRKLNIVEKERVWVLCSGDDVVWVVGHRVDQRYAISDDTKKVTVFKL